MAARSTLRAGGESYAPGLEVRPLHYTDQPDEVAEQVFAGISFMAQHKVPTNPNNIAVWYAYASGRYPDLCRAIDEVIADRRPFSEDLCSDIYEKYFSMTRESELVEDASARIVDELHRAQEYVASANQHTSEIGERMQGYSAQLEGSPAANGVRAVIDHLVEETRAIDSEASNLASNLGEVAGEIRAVVDKVVCDSRSLTDQTGKLADQLETTVFKIGEIEREFKGERAESLADALTGVRNIKFFHVALQAALQRARETGTPLSICLVDLDHFRPFNQSYGRTVGDQVLRLVARTMVECVKGQDVVGRIGGEEFAVVLPETPRAGALKVAEGVRTAFGRKTLTNRKTGEQYGSITLSVGVCELRAGESAGALLQRAGGAMMSAKEAGRDRVFAED